MTCWSNWIARAISLSTDRPDHQGQTPAHHHHHQQQRKNCRTPSASLFLPLHQFSDRDTMREIVVAVHCYPGHRQGTGTEAMEVFFDVRSFPG